MLRLIFAFVDIALHRRGPDQLPASGFLFGLVLGAYVVVALATVLASDAVAHPVLMIAVDTAFSVAFIWAVLKAFERERRFSQTASALFGTDTLLNLIGLPLIAWNRSLQPSPNEVTTPALFFLILAIWSIDIAGFVMSRALDRGYLIGIAIMMGYVLLSISLRVSLFPVTG